MGSHTGSTRITGKRCLHCGELMTTTAKWEKGEVGYVAVRELSRINDRNVHIYLEAEAKLDAVREVVRETRDDFAPDHPPYDVTDLLDRVEKAMEGE